MTVLTLCRVERLAPRAAVSAASAFPICKREDVEVWSIGKMYSGVSFFWGKCAIK